jgi:hypothetical protein
MVHPKINYLTKILGGRKLSVIMKNKTDKPKIGRPSTGTTPKRYFRMDAKGWQQVETAAIALGDSTSEYVRRVLLKDSSRTIKNSEASQ